MAAPPTRSSELEHLGEDERNQTRRQLMDTRFDPEWLASHPKDRDLVDALERRVADAGRARARANASSSRRVADHDVWDRLPAITCPTYVACGRFDGIAPPGNSAALASRIAGAQLHTYEGGHAFLAQDPRSITDVISFLDRRASVDQGQREGLGHRLRRLLGAERGFEHQRVLPGDQSGGPGSPTRWRSRSPGS